MTARLTKKRHRKIQRYVDTLASNLGLEGWVIDVRRDMLPQDDKAFASATFYGPRRYARLHVREDFYDYTPEAHRVALLHEVLHCHLGGPREGTAMDLRGIIDDDLAELACKVYIERMEWATDALSCGLADLFPLPDLV